MWKERCCIPCHISGCKCLCTVCSFNYLEDLVQIEAWNGIDCSLQDLQRPSNLSHAVPALHERGSYLQKQKKWDQNEETEDIILKIKYIFTNNLNLQNKSNSLIVKFSGMDSSTYRIVYSMLNLITLQVGSFTKGKCDNIENPSNMYSWESCSIIVGVLVCKKENYYWQCNTFINRIFLSWHV